MQNTLKLFMILLGFNWKKGGFTTEQHDIIFLVGNDINDPALLKQIKSSLPEEISQKASVHIDAYVEITQADGYRVEVFPKQSATSDSDKKLYFINLGGYLTGQFKEFHKPLLLVDTGVGTVLERAKKDSFMFEMEALHVKAIPHVDDNHSIQSVIDDYVDVAEKIQGYQIVVTPHEGVDSIENPVILGYEKVA